MPFDKKMYHPKWSLIVRLIQRRAANKCERCGVENRVTGYRDRTGKFWTEAEFGRLLEGSGPEYEQTGFAVDVRKIKIVCTTAHLDQNRDNNRFSNLAYLCQRCHFAHDRKANAYRRRFGKHVYDENLKIELPAVTASDDDGRSKNP